MIRWVAIFGQISALFIAISVYNLQFDLVLCMVTISVAIAANFYSIFKVPENKRVSDADNMRTILFEVFQQVFTLFDWWIAKSL